MFGLFDSKPRPDRSLQILDHKLKLMQLQSEYSTLCSCLRESNSVATNNLILSSAISTYKLMTELGVSKLDYDTENCIVLARHRGILKLIQELNYE